MTKRRLPIPSDPAEIQAAAAHARSELERWEGKREEAGELARAGERWYRKMENAKKKIRYWSSRLKRLTALLPDEPEPVATEPTSEPEPVQEPVAEPEPARFDQSRIFVEWQVQRRTRAWAPWGDSGWSAVIVNDRRRTRARVDRVNPRTNEPTAKGSVRCDELVRRDPDLKGRDRPAFAPSHVFEGIRRVRAQIKEERVKRRSMNETEETSETEETPTVVDDRPPEERLKRLLALTDDEATAEDW